jgi:hypothetical protein
MRLGTWDVKRVANLKLASAGDIRSLLPWLNKLSGTALETLAFKTCAATGVEHGETQLALKS